MKLHGKNLLTVIERGISGKNKTIRCAFKNEAYKLQNIVLII